MNPDALKRNMEIVLLSHKIESNRGIGKIVISNFDRTQKSITHHIYLKYSLPIDEEGDDINTFRKIVELCDDIFIVPIIHNEDCVEGLEEYNMGISIDINNVWKKHKYR